MTISTREAETADAAGIARVHVDTWRSTYSGIVPDNFLDRLSYESRADLWRRAARNDDTVLLIAEAESEVVGFAAAGPSRVEHLRFEAELYAIYVLEAHQGHGIGRALAQGAVEKLLAAGMSSMVVWVLAENPYREFYSALGGRSVAERHLEVGGARLREIAYGWDNLNSTPFLGDES